MSMNILYAIFMMTTKIFNVSGYNYTLNNNDKIINYGLTL